MVWSLDQTGDYALGGACLLLEDLEQLTDD